MPVVELTVDSSGAVTGLKQYDAAAKRADAPTSKLTTGVGKLTGAFGQLAAIGTAVAGSALVGLGAKAIQAASNLEETQGKFDVVFRDIGTYAEDAAARISDSYGMSEQATKQYLSSIQDLLVPTGLARDEAAEMSVKFTELAADLGSFNNMPTAQVVRDIQSALAGGSETMTKYGIDVKVAAVNAEILALGLDTSTKALERQARTQAILSIALRDSADAVGDFERTQDSFANQMKIANATIKDFSAEVGQKILPYVTEAISSFNKWAKEGQGLAKMFNYLVEGIRFVHNGISGLIVVGNSLVVAFAHMFNFIVDGFTMMMKPASYFFSLLQKAGLDVNNPFIELESTLKTFSTTLVHSSQEVMTDHFKKIEANNAMYDKWKININSTKQASQEQAAAVDRMTKAVADETQEVKNETQAAEEAVIANEALSEVMGTDVTNGAYSAAEAIAAATNQLQNFNQESTGESGASSGGSSGSSSGSSSSATSGVAAPGTVSRSRSDDLYGLDVYEGGIGTGMTGPAFTINVSQKVSRSDVVAIANELDRSASR